MSSSLGNEGKSPVGAAAASAALTGAEGLPGGKAGAEDAEPCRAPAEIRVGVARGKRRDEARCTASCARSPWTARVRATGSRAT